jgi:hypothetical protein
MRNVLAVSELDLTADTREDLDIFVAQRQSVDGHALALLGLNERDLLTAVGSVALAGRMLKSCHRPLLEFLSLHVISMIGPVTRRHHKVPRTHENPPASGDTDGHR